MEAVMDPIAQTIEEPVDAVTHAPVPVRAVSVRAPRRGRVLAFVYTGAGLAMVPWLFVLGSLLPATTVVPHYSLAWIGLDSLEAVGLFTQPAKQAIWISLMPKRLLATGNQLSLVSVYGSVPVAAAILAAWRSSTPKKALSLVRSVSWSTASRARLMKESFSVIWRATSCSRALG